MKPKLEKWRLGSRRSDHVKLDRLYLYPELDCSSCVDDCYGETGEEQLAYYCDYIKRRYPQWWEADAVPIYWSVMGEGDSGFGCEAAPCNPGDNVLTYYRTPINDRTGAPLNWYSLPVLNLRFPQFAKALGWLPAPFQMFAPLRSIMAGIPPVKRSELVENEFATECYTVANSNR